jgi:hypothetical protein
MHSICWASVEIVRFTIQHAKNIRKGHGIPIGHDAIAFLQLVYLWSRMSTRLPNDPFLSYRSDSGTLHCLVYPTVHGAIVPQSLVLTLNGSNPIRMAASKVLRASGGDDGDILYLGRWKCRKQVPTSLIFQGTSTKNNNKVLRAVSSPTLFTAADINLSWLLPAVKGRTSSTQILIS